MVVGSGEVGRLPGRTVACFLDELPREKFVIIIGMRRLIVLLLFAFGPAPASATTLYRKGDRVVVHWAGEWRRATVVQAPHAKPKAPRWRVRLDKPIVWQQFANSAHQPKGLPERPLQVTHHVSRHVCQVLCDSVSGCRFFVHAARGGVDLGRHGKFARRSCALFSGLPLRVPAPNADLYFKHRRAEITVNQQQIRYPLPPSRNPFPVGASVQVFWGGRWYPATVLKVGIDRWYIHYPGYTSSWDEWVGPARIRKIPQE